MDPDALFAAVELNDLDGVRRYIATGSDVNVSTDYGTTPLANASYWGKQDVVDALLAGGADPNFWGSMGTASPLHAAVQAYGDSHTIVTSLLAAGADPNARNHYGQTPLYVALHPEEHTPLTTHALPTIQALIDGGAIITDDIEEEMRENRYPAEISSMMIERAAARRRGPILIARGHNRRRMRSSRSSRSRKNSCRRASRRATTKRRR
jgi:hypothetical protein